MIRKQEWQTKEDKFVRRKREALDKEKEELQSSEKRAGGDSTKKLSQTARHEDTLVNDSGLEKPAVSTPKVRDVRKRAKKEKADLGPSEDEALQVEDMEPPVLPLLSDLRDRIAVEGDAITRAKEFLRRQRRSVQRRQAALEDARKEWTNDMSQNFARGKPLSSRNANFLEDVRTRLDEEEAELGVVMEHMSAGQELLRQKEDRLKVLETALLGGL
ncbi:Ubiquitin-protein ligase E3A, partial [Desmophyllum pertusum]